MVIVAIFILEKPAFTITLGSDTNLSHPARGGNARCDTLNIHCQRDIAQYHNLNLRKIRHYNIVLADLGK